jgi:hypothetical protein
MKTTKIVSSLMKNDLQDLQSPFKPTPALSSFKPGARSKKQEPRRPKSSFYGDTRQEIDGTWNGGVNSTQIPNFQCPDDQDLFPSNVYDDAYNVDYCYSHVCMVEHSST